MKQMELVNKILKLIPDAKFSVWSCEKKDYQGEGEPIELYGLLVSWNSTNEKPCPMEDQLDQVF